MRSAESSHEEDAVEVHDEVHDAVLATEGGHGTTGSGNNTADGSNNSTCQNLANHAIATHTNQLRTLSFGHDGDQGSSGMWWCVVLHVFKCSRLSGISVGPYYSNLSWKRHLFQTIKFPNNHFW